jgi:toxin ParE1/3/4
VADNPALGKACDELFPGLRRIPEGSHVVYFREVGGEVEILRVLHERMLPERHLRF